MPVCCVKNCKSRTGSSLRDCAKASLYKFPKDHELRMQWLKVCGWTEESLKICRAAVCERHFLPEYIEEKLTSNQSKVIRRRKKGAIPTELLHIPKESVACSNELQVKKPHRTGIPSYQELVLYAKKVDEAEALTGLDASEITSSGNSKCVVRGCLSGPEISLHRFPRDISVGRRWVDAVQNSLLKNKTYNEILTEQYCVCYRHFCKKDRIPGSKRPRLKHDAVPSRHLLGLDADKEKVQLDESRRNPPGASENAVENASDEAVDSSNVNPNTSGNEDDGNNGVVSSEMNLNQRDANQLEGLSNENGSNNLIGSQGNDLVASGTNQLLYIQCNEDVATSAITSPDMNLAFYTSQLNLNSVLASPILSNYDVEQRSPWTYFTYNEQLPTATEFANSVEPCEINGAYVNNEFTGNVCEDGNYYYCYYYPIQQYFLTTL